MTSSIKRKANKYKVWSRTSVLAITGLSAATPVFIGLGGDWLFAKAIPSVLAAASALTAAWIQLERPHERWKLYRRYQRLLEAEQLDYRFNAGNYSLCQDTNQLLAHRLGELQIQLHEEWEGIIPAAKELERQVRTG